MITVYGMKASGNCYKVQLLLAHLGQEHRWVEVDSTRGETRTADFLAKNANGKVPLLELDDGRLLPESNAILCYLADGTSFLPAERWARAQVLQWQFFEQYSHEPHVAVARFIAKWLPADHPRRADLPRLRERAHQALAVMEQRLARHEYLTDAGYTVADIALYAYTHDAPAGGVELSAYPGINRWLERVAAQPGFIPQSA